MKQEGPADDGLLRALKLTWTDWGAPLVPSKPWLAAYRRFVAAVPEHPDVDVPLRVWVDINIVDYADRRTTATAPELMKVMRKPPVVVVRFFIPWDPPSDAAAVLLGHIRTSVAFAESWAVERSKTHDFTEIWRIVDGLALTRDSSDL